MVDYHSLEQIERSIFTMSSDRTIQVFLVVFIVSVLTLLTLTGYSNSALFGVLLALAGPAMAALLTNQAVNAAVNTANRTAVSGNGTGGNTNA